MAANTITAPAKSTRDVTPAVSDYPAGWNADTRGVWDALMATGGGTVAVIAKSAGVSQKIVKDALKIMSASDHVTRDGDVWHPTTTPTIAPAPTPDRVVPDIAPDAATPAPDVPSPSPDGDTAPAPASAPDAPAPLPALTPEAIADAMRIMGEETDRRTAAKAELAERERQEEIRRAAAVAELERARAAESAREGLADLIASATAAYAAVAGGSDADAINAALAPVFDATNALAIATGNARPRRARTGGGTIPTGGPVATGDRKPPAPLRPAVTAHMAAHPDTDFTPGEIARVLDRSSGAVANALATMANQGEAVLTCETPMRYRAATPTATDGPVTGADA